METGFYANKNGLISATPKHDYSNTAHRPIQSVNVYIGLTSILNMNRSRTHTTVHFGLHQRLAPFRAFPFNIRITVIGESDFAFYFSTPRYTF